MNSETVPYIVIMVFCVIMSAYFSATETAFSSLNRTRLKALAEKGEKRAALASELAEQYDKLISTILIGNNIVNITVASIGTVLFVKIYGDIGATISTVVVTVMVLIFGEITPKSIAKDCPERFAMFSAPIISALIWLLTPANFLFSMWKKMISKVFNVQEDNKMSQEELLMLVEEVQQDGSIDQNEGSLLKNAIEFSDRKAEDILTHRTKVEAVSVDSDKIEIAKVFSRTQFSRLPVYDGTVDNVVGVIYQKDFYCDGAITEKSVSELMVEPLFVQQGIRIHDLMKLLNKQKSHIAIVLDEYGGTYGIVTMEDILEELVGEIWDEHDEVVEMFRRKDEHTWLVDGSVSIDDFAEHFDIKCESESNSLSGWVMEQLDKVAEEGDYFTYENLELKVVETDAHRVTVVEVICKDVKNDETEE